MTSIIVSGAVVVILLLNQPEEFELHWWGWMATAVTFFLGFVKSYKPKQENKDGK